MSDDKAKAAFQASIAGSEGTSNWDELSETVKSAWRAVIETTRSNDPKLVNQHATGTVGSMIGSNPNVNPHAAPTAAAADPASKDEKKK